jgi:hypothetical protein
VIAKLCGLTRKNQSEMLTENAKKLKACAYFWCSPSRLMFAHTVYETKAAFIVLRWRLQP